MLHIALISNDVLVNTELVTKTLASRPDYPIQARSAALDLNCQRDRVACRLSAEPYFSLVAD